MAIRGEDIIQVLDGTTYKPTRQIKVRSTPWCRTQPFCCPHPIPQAPPHMPPQHVLSVHHLLLLQVPQGPGMIIFSPDGRLAYICSSFTPETVIIDTATYATVGRVKQASTFCPNIAATPDGSQVGRCFQGPAQPPSDSGLFLLQAAAANLGAWPASRVV